VFATLSRTAGGRPPCFFQGGGSEVEGSLLFIRIRGTEFSVGKGEKENFTNGGLSEKKKKKKNPWGLACGEGG